VILDFRVSSLDWARGAFGVRRSAFGVHKDRQFNTEFRTPNNAPQFNPKSKIQNPKSLALLIVAACVILAAPLSARTAEQADLMYHQIGAQMFCVCGTCREGMLVCSMNNCRAKELQQAYLHELCADEKYEAPAIKAAMVERFGNGVLQVPEDSHIYPILAIAVVLLAGAFGAGFWAISRRGHEPNQPVAGGSAPDEMEQRIQRELKELE
jgi:cytochrome c-type biogenesis protein CcmH/NrfF